MSNSRFKQLEESYAKEKIRRATVEQELAKEQARVQELEALLADHLEEKLRISETESKFKKTIDDLKRGHARALKDQELHFGKKLAEAADKLQMQQSSVSQAEREATEASMWAKLSLRMEGKIKQLQKETRNLQATVTRQCESIESLRPYKTNENTYRQTIERLEGQILQLGEKHRSAVIKKRQYERLLRRSLVRQFCRSLLERRLLRNLHSTVHTLLSELSQDEELHRVLDNLDSLCPQTDLTQWATQSAFFLSQCKKGSLMAMDVRGVLLHLSNVQPVVQLAIRNVLERQQRLESRLKRFFERNNELAGALAHLPAEIEEKNRCIEELSLLLEQQRESTYFANQEVIRLTAANKRLRAQPQYPFQIFRSRRRAGSRTGRPTLRGE